MVYLSRLEQARLERPAASDPQRIRAIATQLIDDLGIIEPPVDVEMVASMLGIQAVTPDDTLPETGCLICLDGDRFEIRVRGADPPGRQRFTVCHECAHTFFPGFATQTHYRCSPDPHLDAVSTRVERLCDVAASELLFPSKLVLPDIRATTFGLAGLYDLAARYGASLEATGHRLIGGWGRQSAALLVFTVREKPAERRTGATPRLRLDYARREGRWPYFTPHKSVTPGDVFDRACQGEVVSETTAITAICSEPVWAEVHAWPSPIAANGVSRERVIALARQVRR